jgi:hypothetical protein
MDTCEESHIHGEILKEFVIMVRLYQINADRQKEQVMFESYDSIISKHGVIPAELYDIVFDGDIGTHELIDIWLRFNVAPPNGYTGRSMSVSDVVEICDESGGCRFVFCDTVGFKEIEFDNSLCGRCVSFI